jgi:hypothetical protein
MLYLCYVLNSNTYSVYSCCYATFARSNMLCLVTAGKRVNDSRAIARHLVDKRVPAAPNTRTAVEVLLDYDNENDVFCVGRSEMLYATSVSFWSW